MPRRNVTVKDERGVLFYDLLGGFSFEDYFKNNE